MSDNRKIVHDIKGKLSPVSHLIWCAKNQPHEQILENVDLAKVYFDKVLELLDEIE